MKTRFILQILYKNATQYLQYLRIIDKKSEVIENKLHQSQKNEELIELLELQKSLVYFTTSLRSNEVVLEKLLRIDKIKKYPEDTDLLEDVIVENKQAMEMTSIYNGILSGTMDTFASVISNNLNIVMKFLATVTIVMSIPTMIASFYGMNVRASGMPFAESPYGFGIVLFFTLLLTLIVAYIFNKKDLFKSKLKYKGPCLCGRFSASRTRISSPYARVASKLGTTNKNLLTKSGTERFRENI